MLDSIRTPSNLRLICPTAEVEPLSIFHTMPWELWSSSITTSGNRDYYLDCTNSENFLERGESLRRFFCLALGSFCLPMNSAKDMRAVLSKSLKHFFGVGSDVWLLPLWYSVLLILGCLPSLGNLAPISSTQGFIGLSLDLPPQRWLIEVYCSIRILISSIVLSLLYTFACCFIISLWLSGLKWEREKH